MRTTSIMVVTAAMAVLSTACTDQRLPAESAVAKVEASLTEIRADAGKFAAEELAEVEKAVGRLKAKLAEEDYGGALQGAPAVASTVASLKANVERKKADAEEMMAVAQQEWAALSTSMPALVDTLQKRIDSMRRSGRLPQGMDRQDLEAARADVEKIKTPWAEASKEYEAGMAADAVRRARAAKTKGEWLAHKFGA